MQSLVGLSMLAVLVVTLGVGFRLLALARRTRRLPELAFGVAFVGGAVGTAGAQIGQRAIWTEPGLLASVMNATCFGFQVVGTLALFFVIWRVFRPGRGPGMALFAVGSALTLLAFALRAAHGDLMTARLETPGLALFQLARGLSLVWSSSEAFHYASQLRRRSALGLADPVAAAQIRLWGVAGIATLSTVVIIASCIFVLHVHPLTPLWSLLGLTAISFVISGSMWCAFFPPEALRRRVLARAAL